MRGFAAGIARGGDRAAHVTVVVPFFGGGDPLRNKAFHRVRGHLAGLGWPIIVAGDPGRSKSVAVNTAARNLDTDVIVLNDADSVCPHEQIREAARLAAEAPGLVFAYDWYVRLDENDRPAHEWEATDSHACVAIRRRDFLEVGGLHEGMSGWAPDDTEFNRRAAKHWPHRRVHGEVVHIWHGERRGDDSPLDTDPEQVAANYKVMNES